MVIRQLVLVMIYKQVRKAAPIMVLILPIILSRTSQNFYPVPKSGHKYIDFTAGRKMFQIL